MNQNQNLFKSQEPFQAILAYYKEAGFSAQAIYEAWKNSKHRPAYIFQELQKLQNNQNKIDVANNENDSQIKKAIQQSLKSDENPRLMQKKDLNLPSGLMNIGRTCYFNVVIQTLFNIKKLRDLLLYLNIEDMMEEQSNEKNKKYIGLLYQFQYLFVSMLKGKQKYYNPKDLFENLTKLNGDYFQIGEENDFWEFQNYALEQLEKGFNIYLQQEDKQDKKSQQQRILYNSYYQNNFLLKEQDNKINNPITDLFYGKIQECITYQENNEQINKFNEFTQGTINLNVIYNNLYKSFEQSQQIDIPDYEIFQGKKVNAKINIKIKQPPQVMIFYINRLDYDKQNYNTIKLNNTFFFDKEIFIHKYCVNQQGDGQFKDAFSNQEQQQIDQIDKKIQKIQNKLQEYNDFDIEQAFSKIDSFYQKQQQDKEEFEVINDVEIDCNINQLNEKNLKQFLETLQHQKSVIVQHKQKLIEQLNELKKKRADIYNKNPQYCYQLFSILMHDGNANSGHYYCYVYNEKQKKWFKYNDKFVSEANEEELFKEAYGNEHSFKNACCLFYKTKVMINNEIQNSTISGKLLKKVQDLDKSYSDKADLLNLQDNLDYLSTQINSYIDDMKKKEPENNSLTQLQAKKVNFSNIVNDLTENSQFFQILNKLSTFQSYLLIFPNFQNLALREKLIELGKEGIQQSELNKEIKDMNNLQVYLENNYTQFMQIKDQNMYQKLNSTYNQLCKILFVYNQCIIQLDKVKQFTSTLSQLVSLLYFFDDLNQLGGVFAYMLKTSLIFIIKVFILRGCFNIDLLIQQNDYSEINQMQNVICVCTNQICTDDQLFKAQVETNLKNTLNTYAELKSINYFTQENKSLYQQNMQKLNSKNEKIQNCVALNLIEKPPNVQKLIEEFIKNWKEQISIQELWIKFVKSISENQIIKQQNRINQEELKYVIYIN